MDRALAVEAGVMLGIAAGARASLKISVHSERTAPTTATADWSMASCASVSQPRANESRMVGRS